MTLRLGDALKVVEGAINRARELDMRIRRHPTIIASWGGTLGEMV